jgi:hypothetical protein
LKLKRDEPLSKFAFKFNLRHYIGEAKNWMSMTVGRCRLTVSKPELKARLVSALETKMC